MTPAQNIQLITLADLTEPDFVPMRDSDSIIGFQHERKYSVGACNADGFVCVSMTRWSWSETLEQTRRFLGDGSHHVLIEALEIIGQGYFRPTRKCHFSARVTR